ncbi:YbbR-like domain-containing protein [Nannocystaceae bacterium ST9]
MPARELAASLKARFEARRIAEFLIEAATANWGTKMLAFVLALIVFVVTRDEVQRSFTIPLRVVQDPDRVLLTDVPKTVEVRLRGPWTAVNRIGADTLGPALLDLREVRPGPMELDPAAIVMPAGVVLDALDYDPIDLRFDPMVERSVAIRAVIVGEVATDYTLIDHELLPDHWTLRGPESQLAEITELTSEPIDLSGVKRDLDVRVVVRPPSGINRRADPDHPLVFVGLTGDQPMVRFTADIEPQVGELAIEVDTAAAVRALLPDVPEAEIPISESVTIRGPLPLIHEIDDLAAPLRPVVELEVAVEGQPLRAKLGFDWALEVPQAARAALSISPPLVILQFAAGEPAR